MAQGEIVRSFLLHAMNDYNEGKDVRRVGNENFMEKFRLTLKPGDFVLTKGGLMGLIEKTDDGAVKLHTGDNNTVWVLLDFITDRLRDPNPEVTWVSSLTEGRQFNR